MIVTLAWPPQAFTRARSAPVSRCQARTTEANASLISTRSMSSRSSPVLMLTAPITATARALHRTGLTLTDIDLIEINEAFASVVLAWQRETGADLARVNVSGGAIALGHPLGATGARLLTTLVHALERTGGRRGLVTMCEGGGRRCAPGRGAAW